MSDDYYEEQAYADDDQYGYDQQYAEEYEQEQYAEDEQYQEYEEYQEYPPEPEPQPLPQRQVAPSQMRRSIQPGPPVVPAPARPIPPSTRPRPSQPSTADPVSSGVSAAGTRRGLMRPTEARMRKRDKTPPRSSKIDERNIPRVHVSNEVLVYNAEPRIDKLPPPSRSPYISRDMGNATPRHVRMTLYNIPVSGETADKCNLAIGAVVQPLANIGLEEDPIPIVDMGANGPLRCEGCRGYINPHVRWSDGGRVWICNLCELSNECPTFYRSNLDGNGQRRDRNERFELHRGSVDFVAPASLKIEMQKQPGFFFVIDVSAHAYQRGLVQLSIGAIRNALDGLRETLRQTLEMEEEESAEENSPCKLRVGFLTYDDKIHFHGLSDGSLHVISQVDDPFVALPSSEILVPLLGDDASYQQLDQLLQRIPDLFAQNAYRDLKSSKTCVGAALSCAQQVLAESGGKIFVIQTHLPDIGVGKLEFRDNVELYGTAKERDLYQPQSNFYTDITNDCSSSFIAVDLFGCSTSGYLDIASVGEICRKTGGQIYYYGNFDSRRDGEKFEKDISSDVNRNSVFNSVMAVRASKGLEVVDYLGSFLLTENQEIQLPTVTSDTTIAVRLQHYEKLDVNCNCSLQIAMLYLTVDGSAFIRVHTIAMPVVRKIADVFRCVDMDAVLNVSLKQCAHELISPLSNTTTVAQAREQLTRACVDILYTYRRFCAAQNAMRQLVLPEALKLLPLFTLGLLKNGLLCDKIPPDERAFHISYALNMPTYQSVSYVHPYLYPMHYLSDAECVVSESGRVLLPTNLQLTKNEVKTDGLYVLDIGRKLYICVGPQLDETKFAQAFVQSEEKEGGLSLREDFEEDVNDLGYRLSLLLDELRYDKPFWLEAEIMLRPDTKSNEPLTAHQQTFLTYFIEDAARLRQSSVTNSSSGRTDNPQKMSYVDFLVHIHKEIQKKFIDQ